MIEIGQIYRSVKPTYAHGWDGHTRIRISGDVGYPRVDIVTITQSGREVRPRSINASELHESAFTAHGDARRTGYILEKS